MLPHLPYAIMQSILAYPIHILHAHFLTSMQWSWSWCITHSMTMAGLHTKQKCTQSTPKLSRPWITSCPFSAGAQAILDKQLCMALHELCSIPASV